MQVDNANASYAREATMLNIVRPACVTLGRPPTVEGTYSPVIVVTFSEEAALASYWKRLLERDKTLSQTPNDGNDEAGIPFAPSL